MQAVPPGASWAAATREDSASLPEALFRGKHNLIKKKKKKFKTPHAGVRPCVGVGVVRGWIQNSCPGCLSQSVCIQTLQAGVNPCIFQPVFMVVDERGHVPGSRSAASRQQS